MVLVSVLGIAAIFAFIVLLGFTFFELFLWEIGIPILGISILLFFYHGIGTIVYYPIGWLVDRFGPRIWIVTGLLLTGAGFALLSLVDNFLHAILIVPIIGVGTSFFALPLQTYFADIIPEKRRGTLLGLSKSLILAAKSIAPVSAGFLFAVAITLPFIVSGILALSLIIIVMLFMKQDSDRSVKRREQKVPKEKSKHIPPGFYALVAWGVLATISFGSIGFITIFLSEVRGFEPATIGLFFTLLLGLGAITTTPGGWLVDRVGKTGALIAALGNICRALFFLLIPLLAFSPLALYAIVLVELPYSVTIVWTRKKLFEIVPPEHRGRLFAIDMTVAGIAASITPLVYGILWHHIGPSSVFYLSGFVLVGGGILLFTKFR